MAYKNLLVNSPPGSGNVFCQRLLSDNLHVETIWSFHEVEAFDKYENSLFILRNPYDVISSGIEVQANDLMGRGLEYFNNNMENRINHKLIKNLHTYEIFLNTISISPKIKSVTFEFLTNSSEEFLNSMSRHFSLDFKENRSSPERILKYLSHHPNPRVPRAKTELRKIIESIVSDNKHIKDVYLDYLRLKEVIQSTENN